LRDCFGDKLEQPTFGRIFRSRRKSSHVKKSFVLPRPPFRYILKRNEAMKHIPLALILLFGITAVLAGGCARPEVSGFLAPYTGFEKAGVAGPDLQYIRPGVDWAKYKKVRICHVVVYMSPESGEYRAVNPDDLRQISDYFESQLVKYFSQDFQVTDQPGPDVLDVRAALTRLRPTSRAADAAGWAIPGSFVLTMGYQAATNKSLAMGEAGMEVELRDSLTHQRVYGYVGLHLGSSLEPQQATRWGIAQHALEEWAKKLVQELLKLQGREKKPV
jgi:hypothetical protein